MTLSIQLHGVIFEEESDITLTETLLRYRVSKTELLAMVEEGILDPVQASHPVEAWHFNPIAIKRLQITQRLEHDLQVNLPGAALILDLLEQLERQ